MLATVFKMLQFVSLDIESERGIVLARAAVRIIIVQFRCGE